LPSYFMCRVNVHCLLLGMAHLGATGWFTRADYVMVAARPSCVCAI
jgi:hypothetical protein